MILLDTNVVIDVSSNDPIWGDWSQQQLDAAARREALAINDIVYAELCVGYRRMEEVDCLIAKVGLLIDAIPRRALFLAAKAFQQYRRSGGIKTGVLPDFFIGAHAVVADAALITRDPARYRSYFPGIELIAPNLN
jgi:predicted nucleic acid-binding protein